MSFLDKLQFWKKEQDFSMPTEHDFDFTKPLGEGYPDNTGMNQGQSYGNTPFQQNMLQMPSLDTGFNTNPFQTSALPSMNPSFSQPQVNAGNSTMSKDIEIISAKIDSLRATMESVNQRLISIERLAQSEKQPDYGRRIQW